jgi:hypothetical protein
VHPFDGLLSGRKVVDTVGLLENFLGPFRRSAWLCGNDCVHRELR